MADVRPRNVHPVVVSLPAPLIVAAVLLCAMAQAGVVPFGDHPFVARDGVIQYLGFWGWYHEVLTGEADLGCSFAKGLGGGTFGLFAYYLSSPLALLAAFVDPADMPYLLSFLAPFKLCLAAFTCALYLNCRFRPCWAFSLVGAAYVLGSYGFVDGLNVMWLEAVVLLPLAALGVYRVTRGKGPALLWGSVFAAVVCNWYTAYMVCLFTIPLFFVEMVLRTAEDAAGSGGAPGFWRTAGRYVLAMILGVGAGMVILLPAALAQLSGGNAGSEGGFFGAFADAVAAMNVLDPLSLLRAMVDSDASFAGATNAVRLPVVLLVSAAGFFLVGGRGAGRAKVALALLLALLVASMLVKPLDMVWTGFVRADSYNPRYFFLFAFTLCMCAGFFVDWLRNAFDSCGWRVQGVAVAALCLVLLCADGFLVASTCLSSTALNGYSANSASLYSAYMEDMRSALDEAEERSFAASGDEGGEGASVDFYRVENAATTSIEAMAVADPATAMDRLSMAMTSGEYMAFGEGCLSHYSSAATGGPKELLGSLGYCKLPGTRGVTSYRSPVFLTDSLLGVRYVFAESQPAGMADTGISVSSAEEGYLSDVELYANEYALPVGFAVHPDAQSVEWGSNPFANQEAFVGELLGADNATFYAAASVALVGDEGPASSHAWTVTALEGGPLYAWVSKAPETVDVICDGEFLQTARSYEYDTNVMYLGWFEAGETCEIQLSAANPYEAEKTGLIVRTLDFDAAVDALSVLGGNTFSLTAFEDGYVAGTFACAQDAKLLLTIPYEDGWDIKVNGASVEAGSLNGLICLDMPAGTHEITMEYHVPGLKAGCMVSLISVAAFLAWRGVSRVRNRTACA